MAHYKENYWWDLWVTFFIRENYIHEFNVLNSLNKERFF